MAEIRMATPLLHDVEFGDPVLLVKLLTLKSPDD